MTTPSQLSDRDLLAATARANDACRRHTAELIALLAEVDLRRLYLGESYSSLFTYCTQGLHLSEPAAYSRITAARAARRFPSVLALLADGSITLTTITLLAPLLTDDNHEDLLAAARHKSKRDVERLVAAFDPQPDIASSMRRMQAPRPAPLPSSVPNAPLSKVASSPVMCDPPMLKQSEVTLRHTPAAQRAVVAPLAPERYLVKITIGQSTHTKLERARDLLRHSIPNGDPAAIVDRALTILIEQLERTKLAQSRRPRAIVSDAPEERRRRHVPAAVKRVVWTRDEGRCGFVGAQGRCTETGFLEFHHVVPFAAGGPTSAENLQLRCRSHNAYEASCYFADRSGDRRALSGQS